MSPPGNVTYNRRAALVLGILQVLCAVINIGIQIPTYVEEFYVLGTLSVGIWTGIFFLITGILALVSVKSNTNWMIIAVMVMSIISSLVAAIGSLMASIFWLVTTLTENDYGGDTVYKYKIAEDVTIAHCVVCLCYGICAIVLSAFCCQAVCCGARQNMQVMYITTSTVQPGGQQQATAYVYPVNTASYPPAQASYPPAQASYPPAQASYPPTQASYPPAQASCPPPEGYAQNPHMGPVAHMEAPPPYAEKGQMN